MLTVNIFNIDIWYKFFHKNIKLEKNIENVDKQI